jgi:hypothetical protein
MLGGVPEVALVDVVGGGAKIDMDIDGICGVMANEGVADIERGRYWDYELLVKMW